MNMAFTFNGLKTLRVFSEADEADPALDASFTQGQKSVAPTLGDNLHNWRVPYLHDAVIHGVILMASWRPKPADALVVAESESDQSPEPGKRFPPEVTIADAKMIRCPGPRLLWALRLAAVYAN